MWTSLFGGLGDRLTGRATLARMAPAIVFWLGGLAALWLHQSETWLGWGPARWIASLAHWLGNLIGMNDIPEPPVEHIPQITDVLTLDGAIILVVLAGVSALVAEPLVLKTLQLGEGHWPSWLRSAFNARIERKDQKAQADLDRYRVLMARADSVAGTPEEDELFKLIRDRTMLASTIRTMPTILGDRIAAGEDRPEIKYGLNVTIWWPRLWLVMPEESQRELVAARGALDEGACVLLWSVLFGLWTIWAWPALPVAAVTAQLAYRWMIRSGTTYATLVETAFDVHRNNIYRALRWPLPKTPEDEFETTKKVNQYLVLGPREARLLQKPEFTNGPNADEDGGT